jgi:hypothetical protein
VRIWRPRLMSVMFDACCRGWLMRVSGGREGERKEENLQVGDIKARVPFLSPYQEDESVRASIVGINVEAPVWIGRQS